MDIKEQILVALGLNKAEEIKLEFQAKTEDGTIVVSTADELASGVDISVLTEDGTTIPLPPGTYKLDTGVSFIVEEEGKVSEVMEAEAEETEAEEEEEKEEMAKEEEEKEYEEEEKEMADCDFEEVEKRLAKLEEEIEELKKKEYGDKEKEEEMSEALPEPSDKPRTKTTKTTETIEFSLEELKAENDKLRAELDKSPADAPITTKKTGSARVSLSKRDYNRLNKNEKFLYNLNKL